MSYPSYDDLKKGVRHYMEEAEKLKKIVDEYAVHSNRCILSFWEAGEPTPGGGYRSKYAGKWYQTKPKDETPKCTCGLAEALEDL